MLKLSPSEWLSNIGVAKFAPGATYGISAYSRAWAERSGADSDRENSFQAFNEFEAVEFAMMPLYRGSATADEETILPVHVTTEAAADALFKTDCGPFMEHVWKEQHQLRPWDLFAFAGDMSKAELLGFSEDVNVLAEPQAMEYLIQQMAERYIQAGLGDRIVKSGLLAAQGLVWSAKLAVLRGEDYTEHGASSLSRFRVF
jgi:hypothetical protein